MAGVDISDALAFLQKTTSDGSTCLAPSMYEHLTRVIIKILEDKPANAVDLLETSHLIKCTAFDAKETSALVPIPVAPDVSRTAATANLFGKPDLPIDPDSGEPVEAQTPNEYTCDDIKADAVMFESLGVGIGKEDMYGVMLAAKALGEEPKRRIASVRFFGKFLGLYADYYVFETKLRDPPEAAADAMDGDLPLEVGTGANSNTYFVCNYLGGEVTQLPAAVPSLIKAARSIKKILTGRLTSHVSSFPPFAGTEADFLRSQIARIACTTVCAPANYFNPPEEEGMGITANEEYEVPENPLDMGTVANWVHWYPHLKKQGRCDLFKRPVPEDVEDEEEFFTPDEKEEGPELLASLEAENPEEAPPAWSSLFSSSCEAVKNQVAGLRSNLWPGAFCASKGKRFANIYVGWGHKNVPFVPLAPLPVDVEFDLNLVQSQELALKPVPEVPEEEEADE